MSGGSDDKKLRLIVLAAPSGGGKTTLCELLLREFSEIQLSISTTTRPKRPTELDGTHYHFVSDQEFKRRIKEKNFAEWAHVHNHLYGTSCTTIEKAFQSNHHLLFDIDVQGAKSLKQLYPQRALLIFIHPPSLDELERRLRGRKGDSEEAIQNRLANARAEIAESPWFDYQLVNQDLNQTYLELREIVKRECHL